jgi:hypothetical protein
LQHLFHVVGRSQRLADAPYRALQLVAGVRQLVDGVGQTSGHIVESERELTDLVLRTNRDPVIETTFGDRHRAFGQLLERLTDQTCEQVGKRRSSEKSQRQQDQQRRQHATR